MKILLISELHHPDELAKAQAAAPPGETVFFPPSQADHFWIRSLRKQGHQVDVFLRNLPAVLGWRSRHTERFTGRFGLSMIMGAVAHRIPRAHPDYWLRNRRLLHIADRLQPDAILLTGGNRVIFPETLAQIKARYDCKLVYLTGVSPIVFSSALERAAAPLYDLVIVNDYYHGIQMLELGAARMEALPVSACAPDYHHPYELSQRERAEFSCDTGFAGTLLPPNLYSNRVRALEAVREYGLGVWSVHGIPESLRPYYRGPALGERMLRIICGSKIQINPHGNFMRYGGNMRTFEAAGCGVFQITDDLPGTTRWFKPGEHLVVYRDMAHLREMVAYYLKHDDERCQIAAAARAHVYAHHTYDQRMAAIVSLL